MLKIQEQGRLLKAIFETSQYDALIGDLVRAIRTEQPPAEKGAE